MGFLIPIHQDALELLEKYCKVRPSQSPLIIGRVLREWYSKAALMWKKNPRLIPDLVDVPESELQNVEINKDIAKTYYSCVYDLKQIVNKTNPNNNFTPENLAVFLMNMFINAFRIKEVQSKDKSRKMDVM